MQNQNTPAQEKHTVYLFNAEHADKTAAKQAGKLFTLDIEHPMTLNDLSLLCESVADAVGALAVLNMKSQQSLMGFRRNTESVWCESILI
uniref:hypothetical protein n=1 Tax=Escherichia coli TaxID=562 RepID=UPI0020355D34|nr:hypothetical protein [Escherichia coli]